MADGLPGTHTSPSPLLPRPSAGLFWFPLPPFCCLDSCLQAALNQPVRAHLVASCKLHAGLGASDGAGCYRSVSEWDYTGLALTGGVANYVLALGANGNLGATVSSGGCTPAQINSTAPHTTVIACPSMQTVPHPCPKTPLR